EDKAVINRMGFTNEGQPAAFARLEAHLHLRGVIGVNIGANKDSSDWVADYANGVRAMRPVARYLTINISSPNTPGLRGLQDKGLFEELLSAVQEARRDKPIFLKVAPDLDERDAERTARAATDHKIDALIAS